MRYLVMVMVIGMMGSILTHMSPGRSSPSATEDAFRTAAGDYGDARPKEPPPQAMDGSVQLQRSSNGHFYADVEINGAAVHMLVDTGASGIALSREDARKAGIATSIGMNEVVGQGADGGIHGEFVRVDRVTLGQKTAERMEAMVLNNGEQSLLGQDFLQKFASVEIRGDTMTLR